MPAPDPAQALHKEARSAVRAIYAELANRPVERNCTQLTECCRFKLTGATPYLTKGEALVAAHGVKASGRKAVPEPPPGKDGACPLLKADGKCLVYADRPFGCRTHFCQAAGGPYARAEVIDLIHQLEAIDRKLGGRGPVVLQKAVGEAFEEL